MKQVILVGDSIRIGYQETVRQKLDGLAEVWCPAANGGTSGNVWAHLTEWVIAHQPDVVYLNAGLHDLRRDSGGDGLAVPLKEYEVNVWRIVNELKKTTRATVIWATTTPVNESWHHEVKGFDRLAADVARYNASAARIVRDMEAVVHDLHAVAMEAGRDRVLSPDGVHFTPDGYTLLGSAVADCIREHLQDTRRWARPLPGTGFEHPDFPVSPDAFLRTLHGPHPRLIFTDAQLAQRRQEAGTDTALGQIVQGVIAAADAVCDEPVLACEPGSDTPSLGVCRHCVGRMYYLGLAWRWTGEDQYFVKALENLMAVCAFENWGDMPHDFGEMAHGVAIAYDWFYPALDETTRGVVRRSLVELCIRRGIEGYEGRGALAWWAWRQAHNMNMVTNAGVLTSALAVAEDEPELAFRCLIGAMESLPNSLRAYEPDGVWPEGVGYWSYGLRYLRYATDSMQTALGSDFGLMQYPGVRETRDFSTYLTGPAGHVFTFGDVKEHRAGQDRAGQATTPTHWTSLIKYVPPEPSPAISLPRDAHLRGLHELALFRNSWTAPSALFVGVKAGDNRTNHHHLDLGNFVMQALGVCWARDLGSDKYSMDLDLSVRQGGVRHCRWRTSSFSHNVPLLGGEGQHEYAVAHFTAISLDEEQPFVTVNLTEAYRKDATSVVRGVAVVNGRQAVLVQDEFELRGTCEVAWGMTTGAEIEIASGGKALLSHNGVELRALVLSPQHAEFCEESAHQEPPQDPNEGIRRLMIRLPDRKGKVRLAVLLAPLWQGDMTVPIPELRPLAEWSGTSEPRSNGAGP